MVEIRPAAEQAGYVSPTNPLATLTSGTPGGTVEVEMIDPVALKPENTYSITFKDTLVNGKSGTPDTVKTKSFTLRNVTDGISIPCFSVQTSLMEKNYQFLMVLG